MKKNSEKETVQYRVWSAFFFFLDVCLQRKGGDACAMGCLTGVVSVFFFFFENILCGRFSLKKKKTGTRWKLEKETQTPLVRHSIKDFAWLTYVRISCLWRHLWYSGKKNVRIHCATPPSFQLSRGFSLCFMPFFFFPLLLSCCLKTLYIYIYFFFLLPPFSIASSCLCF